jgi:GR25 family glycosyltransferase involved in LPS biosynthesis
MLIINSIPAFVIHVKNAQERYENIIKQKAKDIIQNINIFDAYTPDNIQQRNPDYYDKFYLRFNDSNYNRKNCCLTLSHLDIIKTAKKLKFPYVLVLEDDFNIKENFTSNYQIKLHKDVMFDFLYIGGYFDNPQVTEKIRSNIYKVKYASCSVAYIVSQSIYDYYIESIERHYENKCGLLAVDGFFANVLLPEINTLALIPTLINTIPSTSLLTDTYIDHYDFYKQQNKKLNE